MEEIKKAYLKSPEECLSIESNAGETFNQRFVDSMKAQKLFGKLLTLRFKYGGWRLTKMILNFTHQI